MRDSATPIVVLVHGAWHGGWCFAALQSALDGRGIASLAPDLPGHGASLEGLGDLAADAAFVANVLQRVDGPVVLVGHSYGGAVVTQAAAEADNVAHLVYLTAFVPDVGESVFGFVQSEHSAENALTGAMKIGDGYSTIDPVGAHAALYAYCDPAVSDAAIRRLCPQPLATFSQPATGAAWHDLPSTYVRCTRDEAIPVGLQDLMAARCRNVLTLETDHSPFSSQTEATASIIADVVAGIG